MMQQKYLLRFNFYTYKTEKYTAIDTCFNSYHRFSSISSRRESLKISGTGYFLGNWTTRGYANSQTANSRTGHLADWSTHGQDNSRTSQLADWTSRGLDNSRSCRCHQKGKLSMRSRRWHPRVVQSATCPVRELSSPRVDQSARCPVHESSSP